MESTTEASASVFSIKDCALVSIATGKKARQLREFRDNLATIEAASIYHHFWGGLLVPRFEEREYNNDFAAWVRHGVHDKVLAEQLAALDPTGLSDLEQLRQVILDLVDARFDEAEHLSWMRASGQFEFICSQIVVFDTDRRLQNPEAFADVVPGLSTSSIFYHFVDARRRTETGTDDFSEWLGNFGDQYNSLREELADVDPFFGSLSELRNQLVDVFSTNCSESAR
jgi:hypothetical protein